MGPRFRFYAIVRKYNPNIKTHCLSSLGLNKDYDSGTIVSLPFSHSTLIGIPGSKPHCSSHTPCKRICGTVFELNPLVSYTLSVRILSAEEAADFSVVFLLAENVLIMLLDLFYGSTNRPASAMLMVVLIIFIVFMIKLDPIARLNRILKDIPTMPRAYGLHEVSPPLRKQKVNNAPCIWTALQ